MKFLIAGGTGFLGAQIVKQLVADGHDVTLVTRRSHAPENRITYVPWDGQSQGAWVGALQDSDVVINLVGESLASSRWNPKSKERFRASRVETTKRLVQLANGSRVQTFINASAVGYYGHRGDDLVTEDDQPSSDYLGGLCAQWEEAAFAFQGKTVAIRIGIVLGKGGGALAEMTKPFRFFVGGHLGNGRQYFPWIHIEDVAGALLFAVKNPEIKGPLNFTAPNPVTMKIFCRELGRVLGRPSWAHVPGFALRILVGEFSDALLHGQNAIPKKLLDAGYKFRYPQLTDALRSVLIEP